MKGAFWVMAYGTEGVPLREPKMGGALPALDRVVVEPGRYPMMGDSHDHSRHSRPSAARLAKVQ